MRNRIIISLAIIPTFLCACNMEKEIDIDLPDYENKMVIECYLEPGKPYQLLLTESVSYFEPAGLPPTLDSALVIITHNNIIDTLKFDPSYDIATGKFYNYRSSNIVPSDYFSEFLLLVIDRKDRIARGRTSILQPVLIDTVEFQYNEEDSLAFALTRFRDNTSMANYYRYMIIRADTILESPLTSFTMDDVLFKTPDVALGLGSNYELEKDDSIIVSLFHISEDYYKFLQSVAAARDANGNPFGQPASIQSNVDGALGIFTGLAYDRKDLVVK